jgi:hypothetical protein
MTLSEEQIAQRIKELAASMRARGLATSDMQARERARDIVHQEIAMQKSFEAMQNDPSRNPQQRPRTVSEETLKASGGMLTGNELPKDVPLAELLKGRRTEK